MVVDDFDLFTDRRDAAGEPISLATIVARSVAVLALHDFLNLGPTEPTLLQPEQRMSGPDEMLDPRRFH
jgi:hypothetical protein